MKLRKFFSSIQFTRNDAQLLCSIWVFFATMLAISLALNGTDRMMIEEFFGSIKIIGAIYLTYMLLRHWRIFHTIERVSFTSFLVILSVLATINSYRVLFLHESVDLILNLSFHLAVLILYLGFCGMILIRQKCDKKKQI